MYKKEDKNTMKSWKIDRGEKSLINKSRKKGKNSFQKIKLWNNVKLFFGNEIVEKIRKN